MRAWNRRGRYITVELETEIDLADYIDDIVDLYNNDKEFKSDFDASIPDEPDETIESFIRRAKEIRKDSLLWERVKYELTEIIKDDYIVV